MPLTCVALDLETTGLNAERDAIIEIGCVKLEDGRITDEWSTLVNPGRPIPLGITQLTGISSADVAQAPPLALVGPPLLRFVGNLPIVGHNIGFDLGFLAQFDLFRQNLAIDTFDLATVLLPRQERYNLTTLAARFNITLADAHRALDDARASLHLFLALIEVGSRLAPAVLAEIRRLTAHSQWALRPIFHEMAALAASTDPRRATPQVVPGRTRWTDAGYDAALHPRRVPMALDVDALADLLAPGGRLAAIFPGYEHRPQQVDMLRGVADAFNNAHHLLVEAGTGTGKSLAYLLPAAQYAIQNDTRVVVSTNTINLQDQLVGKDIPALQPLLATPARVALVKGRTNYLCPRRFNYLRSRSDLSEDEVHLLVKVLIWLQHTQTGDRDEMMFTKATEQPVWSRVCAERDSCSTAQCQTLPGGPCFFQQARNQAESAHLIVVNHALLLADIAVENRLLPAYAHLIVDEAHHLENAITQQMGFQVTAASFLAFLNELYPAGGGRGGGLLSTVRQQVAGVAFGTRSQLWLWLQRSQDAVTTSRERLPDFLRTLLAFVAEQTQGSTAYDQRVRLTPSARVQPLWDRVEIQWDHLAVAWRQLCEQIEHLRQALVILAQDDPAAFETSATELAGAAQHLRNLDEQVSALVSHPDQNGIYWLELAAENERTDADPLFRLSLRAAPLQVGGLVAQHLLRDKQAVIMTSATLRTAGSFDFLAERLHAWDVPTLAVGSPFDYAASTLLCLPTDIPDPNAQGYQTAVERAIVDIGRATKGRMLVLFTAYNQLKRTRDAITPLLALNDIVVFEQGGGASRRQLMENFKNTERSVLLGTRSFWEGVDIPGEALSCLVIVRLPFAVPNDPIFAARSEAVEEPFLHYAVPDAILRFSQGFGRLIRTRSDRGVCVILDRRVLSKQYGQQFIESLPTCTLFKGPLSILPEQAARWLAPPADRAPR